MTRPLTLRLVPRPRLRMSDAPRAALTCRVLPVFGSAAVAQDAAARAAASEAGAQISAAAASVSEGAAAVSATSSAGSANAAETSATNAATAATQASASATTSSTKAGEAATSASAAAGSAATATTRASEAAASASTASTKAGEAAASASNAATSASAAAGSAANAATTLAGALRFDVAQTLTAPQQALARANAGAQASLGYTPANAAGQAFSGPISSPTVTATGDLWAHAGVVRFSQDGLKSIGWNGAKWTTSQGDIVLLDGAGRLPAVDGSQLTGIVSGRERLAAGRTYYVRTDGADGNTGLANTAGGAFATIQRAVDAALGLDLAGIYTVTIQVADGTYTYPTTIGVGVGIATAANLIIQGNAATPGNVIVWTTGANCFTALGGLVTIKDLEMRTTTSGECIRSDAGVVEFSGVRFGTSAARHMLAISGGQIMATGNYSIVGGAQGHMFAATLSSVRNAGLFTVTLAATPAFSSAFAVADRCGVVDTFNVTYSGTATGKRYDASANGVIMTLGAGANYLPGSAAGTTATGGQYI